MDADDFIVTVDDIRTAGPCARGIKNWFADHQLDFNDFLKNGIPASRLLASGDGYAELIVNKIKEQRNG